MKIVLDTNVLIAAFLTHGICAELVEHCIRHHQPTISPFILKEFSRILREKFEFPKTEIVEAEKLLLSRMISVNPLPLKEPACRDSDDDWVLSTAVSGECHCIITGDKDLLTLKRYQGIDILSPRDFWKYENVI